MPGNDLLLDTNALVALLKSDASIHSLVSATGTRRVSLFTVGEMHYGAEKSARPEANRKALATALASFSMLIPDTATAETFGRVFARLRSKWRPIPTNDIWIAALAIQHDL